MPFSGKATYDNGVFDTIAEDVSDIIGMISPHETPLLDRLGDAPQAAQNVLHEWLEDSLAPSTIISSSTIASNATALGVYAEGATGVGRFLQPGMVAQNKTTGEYIQITATNTNSITITRGFGGTSAATIVAGHQLYILGDVAFEGADVTIDTSRPRSRLSNYCQIFKKDIIVSGTMRAVNNLGNVGDEFGYQKTKKATEALIDLEKTVILGKLSGNTLGSATAYRTMRGIWDHLTTNVTSTATLTPTIVDNIIQGAWDYGANDLDLIICDSQFKRIIDQFNDTRVRTVNLDERFHKRVSVFQGTYGDIDVVLDRWMPRKSLMVLSTQRIKVLPLQGRSFAFREIAPTGDATKGMILGEYTLELKNQEGMAKAYG